MGDDDTARYNVQMPKQLRSDAKRNTERGELSEAVRDLFRRKAYGAPAADESPTELQRKRQELKEARRQLDDYRHERDQLEAKVSSQETRVARLEEQVSELEKQRANTQEMYDVLETMLQNGERLPVTRIQNVTDVDEQTARDLQQTLREEHPDVPDAAFSLAAPGEPTDWKEVPHDP
jgi:septal ring factor EnvC (AmiA/AmiB activator)